jgi:hypothetical protein
MTLIQFLLFLHIFKFMISGGPGPLALAVESDTGPAGGLLLPQYPTGRRGRRRAARLSLSRILTRSLRALSTPESRPAGVHCQ